MSPKNIFIIINNYSINKAKNILKPILHGHIMSLSV